MVESLPLCRLTPSARSLTGELDMFNFHGNSTSIMLMPLLQAISGEFLFCQQ